MNFLLNYYGEFGYLGVLVVLILCGLGLPLPEDITLILAGYLTYLGAFKFIPSIVVALIGVLLGDLCIYYLGRKFGLRVAQLKFFRRYLTEKRLHKASDYYAKYGGKTVFFARFLPGLRAPCYFTAGLVRMRVIKFFAIDFSAAVISVPLIIFTAYYFGMHIDKVVSAAKRARYTAIIAIVLIIALFYIYNRFFKNNKDVAVQQ